MNSITINELFKSYGSQEPVLALQDINLSVPKGDIFGLIGPDGAGKTTLFRILTTLILADKGEASVEGHDVVKDYKKIRRIVGYMPGKFSLYQDLSVRENLEFFATIFQTTIEANYHLIKDIYSQLEPFNSRRAGALSGGMKQKLALCCALVHRPEVLFLDEPTTGVDVVSRKEFWEMLKRLKKEGITVFVSTPYMDEATMCDQIALIQEGKILSVDTPDGLLDNYDHILWAAQSNKMYQALKDLKIHPLVDQCYTFGDAHHLRLKSNTINPADFINYLASKGHEEITFKQIRPTVEDCFMQLMQEENKMG